MDLELKATEKKYIQFIIKDADGNLYNLSGCSATIQIQKYGESTVSLTKSLSISDPTNGVCQMYYDGDLNPGDYRAEIEITTAAGLKYITPIFTIRVLEDIPID